MKDKGWRFDSPTLLKAYREVGQSAGVEIKPYRIKDIDDLKGSSLVYAVCARGRVHYFGQSGSAPRRLRNHAKGKPHRNNPRLTEWERAHNGKMYFLVVYGEKTTGTKSQAKRIADIETGLINRCIKRTFNIAANAAYIDDELRERYSNAQKGHSVSYATRKKLSLSHTGKKLSKAHRESIGNGCRGNKMPEGFGERVSRTQKGKRKSPEMGKNISKAKARTRKERRKSVGYKCMDCGARLKENETDHCAKCKVDRHLQCATSLRNKRIANRECVQCGVKLLKCEKHQRCGRCHQDKLARGAKYRSIARSENRCVSCGKPNDNEGIDKCSNCVANVKAREPELRAKLVREGKCPKCKKVNNDKTYFCTTCRLRINEDSRAYYARHGTLKRPPKL